MRRSLLVCVLGSAGVLFLTSQHTLGDVAHEPTASSYYRDLRSDYVTKWYIYNDSATNVIGSPDGVLRPGDTYVAEFNNWWTPASAHTQHNYDCKSYGTLYGDWAGNPDMPSAPMNHATATLPDGHAAKNDATYNYWLDQVMQANALHFYMTYSQYDNNDFNTFTAGGVSAEMQDVIRQRNMYRNGWALGWVAGDINKSDIDAQESHPVEMAIYVYKGKGLDNSGSVSIDDWGTSRSNPNVSMSNDIDHHACETGVGGQWHPPVFNDDPGVMDYDYSTAAGHPNRYYLSTRDDGNTNGDGVIDSADFNLIRDSMEIRERDPMNMPGLGWLLDKPVDIKNTAALNDPDGNPYEYLDAFTHMGSYIRGSNDGGVIAGLAGQDDYDPQYWDTTWHNQQVIRIDISPETLLSLQEEGGGIDKIIFYDFGLSDPGSTTGQQVNPTPIIFGVDLAQTVEHGQIYYDTAGFGNPADFIYFPDNRIYIARVEVHVPEPATIFVTLVGGAGLLLRRRRAAAT